MKSEPTEAQEIEIIKLVVVGYIRIGQTKEGNPVMESPRGMKCIILPDGKRVWDNNPKMG
jgi:hypothetical protein